MAYTESDVRGPRGRPNQQWFDNLEDDIRAHGTDNLARKDHKQGGMEMCPVCSNESQWLRKLSNSAAAQRRGRKRRSFLPDFDFQEESQACETYMTLPKPSSWSLCDRPILGDE